MKREAGTGCISKSKEKRHKPWRALILDRSSADRHYIYLGYFRTKKEAAEALANYNLSPTDPTITFKQIFDIVIKQKAKEIKSIKSYTVLEPKFGSVADRKFSSLKTVHYQQMMDSLNCGISTKRKMKVMLSLMYKCAVSNDIVNKDYSQFVKLPVPEKNEKEIFTKEEIALLLRSRDVHPDIDSILLMLFTGLRLGEMFGLTLENIDFENRVIKTFGNKTDEGKHRIVPMNDLVYDILYKRFVIEKGSFSFDKSNYYNWHYKRPLRMVGIPYKSPHSCRHTFATMLGESGASTLNIQKLLGHTDYALTANVYSHPDVEELRVGVAHILPKSENEK